MDKTDIVIRKVLTVIFAFLILGTSVYALIVNVFPELKTKKIEVSNVSVKEFKVLDDQRLYLSFKGKYSKGLTGKNAIIYIDDVIVPYEAVISGDKEYVINLSQKIHESENIKIEMHEDLRGKVETIEYVGM